jgi:integrase
MALSPEDRLIPHVPLIRAFNMDLKYAGIEKKDDRGRTVDLHSLRHTFGTLLARSPGRPPPAVQRPISTRLVTLRLPRKDVERFGRLARHQPVNEPGQHRR